MEDEREVWLRRATVKRYIHKDVPCIVLLAAACIVIAGCATEGVRIDPGTEGVASQDFNPTDLRMNVRQGVKKLVRKVRLQFGDAAFDGRPVIFVAKAQNRTDEHIDMTMVQEYLESEIKSNLVISSSGASMSNIFCPDFFGIFYCCYSLKSAF